MDSNDDHRDDEDEDSRLLGYDISRFLILNSPELTYWNEGPKANWIQLPREVLATILLKLGTIEIIDSAQNVCTLWRSVCMDPCMWTHIDMRNLDDDLYRRYQLAKMCRHAIHRSHGGCVDINIENFGDDDLLNYITERYVARGLCLNLGYKPIMAILNFPRFTVLHDSGCKLRRLRLACCWSVSDEGMAQAAPRLSFLETFEYCMGSLAENALKAIGKNCPRLTNLRYEQKSCQPYNKGNDEEAFAIAKHMPGLCHLSLLGNKLTAKGLGAILDGCPHLESLDLRHCFKVDLRVDLEKKCERIKDLKRPPNFTASNDDYEDDYSDSDYISGLDYEDYDAEFSNYFDF